MERPLEQAADAIPMLSAGSMAQPRPQLLVDFFVRGVWIFAPEVLLHDANTIFEELQCHLEPFGGRELGSFFGHVLILSTILHADATRVAN